MSHGLDLEQEIAAARALAEAGFDCHTIARVMGRDAAWVTGAMGLVLDMLRQPECGIEPLLRAARLESVEAWQAYCALPPAARRIVLDSVGLISVDLCRAALAAVGAARSGRPRRLTDEQAHQAVRRLAGGETDTDVAEGLRVSRATLYRAIRRARGEPVHGLRGDVPDGAAAEGPDSGQPGHRGRAGPPCPHCGKGAHAAVCVDRPSDTWRVTCYVCGDMGPPGFGVPGAYAKWSERAPAVLGVDAHGVGEADLAVSRVSRSSSPSPPRRRLSY